MKAGLTCIADKGRGGGYRDSGRQLERVPEQDRVEDAVRGEVHVQVPAPALLRGKRMLKCHASTGSMRGRYMPFASGAPTPCRSLQTIMRDS